MMKSFAQSVGLLTKHSLSKNNVFARVSVNTALVRHLNSTGAKDSVGADNTMGDPDKKRVEEALKVKKIEIAKNADSMTPKDPTKIYNYSSIDFGKDYNLPHPIWHKEFLETVAITHVPRKKLVDSLAYWTIQAIRFNFDWMSGWMFGKPSTATALNRVCFLETVAGVPGSIGGTLRHLKSLRRMRRDNGWIHTLMEEAENERMHLLTFLQLKNPSVAFRTVVWLTQGIFFNFFFVAYLLNPTFCHRLVGYLEEEAVKTYTHILHEIDAPDGSLKEWKTTPAPEIAKTYWKLEDKATMRDVMSVIRADESHHRDVNHAFASMDYHTAVNPFKPGY